MKQNSEDTSKQVRKLIVKPFFHDKSLLFYIAMSLVFLSFAQMMLIILMGPFVKVPLSMSADQTSIILKDVIPEGLRNFIDIDWDQSIELTTLVVAIPLLIIFAQCINAAASFCFNFYRQKLTINVAHHMRSEIFKALVNSRYSKIISRSPAEWMSIIMNDIFFIEVRFSDILSSFVKDGVLIISSFIALMLIHLKTAMYLLVLLPVAILALGRLKKMIQRLAQNYQSKFSILTRAVYDLRERFDFVRSQKGEKYTKEWFDKLNDNYYRAIRNAIAAQSLLSPGLEFVGFALFGIVFYLFTSGYYAQQIDAASVVQFFAALLLVFRPLKNLGLQLAQYSETKGAITEALLLYKDMRDTKPLTSQGRSTRELQQPISIELVRTYFSDRDTTVEAKSVQIAKGGCFAIVGPSGGGKSTFIKTLAGLLEPKVWQANYTYEDVSQMTSMVSQFPFLFNESVKNNLNYGQTDEVSLSEIHKALDSVGFTKTVDQQTIDLDEKLGFGFRNYSGGQRQLLTVARGLLRSKSLLLFDEPTSAIDPRVETFLISNLITYCRDEEKALLMSTHRLAHVELFDKVLFFYEGHLVASGPHSQLIQQNQIYAKFCRGLI